MEAIEPFMEHQNRDQAAGRRNKAGEDAGLQRGGPLEPLHEAYTVQGHAEQGLEEKDAHIPPGQSGNGAVQGEEQRQLERRTQEQSQDGCKDNRKSSCNDLADDHGGAHNHHRRSRLPIGKRTCPRCLYAICPQIHRLSLDRPGRQTAYHLLLE